MMNKNFRFKIVPLLVSLLAATTVKAEDIGTIRVEGVESKGSKRESSDFFNDTIYQESTTDYIDTDTFIKNAPSQKRITPKQALGMAGVQGDPLKALQTFSGVVTVDDSSGELIIHGSKPRENSVSLNHLPIGYLYHSGGLHSIIAPEAVDQIDTYLGGFDVTYGNAMGGVIDITPRYPAGERDSMVHLGVYDSSAGSSFSLSDNISGYVGGRASYYHLFASKTGKFEDDITYTRFPRFYDGTLFLSAGSGNSLFSLEAISVMDVITINTEEDRVKDPEATGEIDSETSFSTIGLRWIYDNGESFRSNTLFYYFNSKEETDLFTENFLNMTIKATGLYHLSTFSLGSHRINAGFEIENSKTPVDVFVPKPPEADDFDYDYTSLPKFRLKKEYSVTTGALFLQDLYEVRENLFFRYGVRLDHTSFGNYDPSIDPRLALIYNIGDSDSASFSAGRYSQYPDVVKNVEKFGNTDLQFERSYHYTFNYSHDFRKSGRLVVEPYYKQLIELAVSDPETMYENEGRGFAYGLDLTYTLRVLKRVNLIIAYTFLKSERELVTSGKAHRFYGEVPHTLQFMSAYSAGKWIFSSRMKYHSGSPFTPVTGTFTDGSGRVRPIYGPPFSGRLPDYFSLDLKMARIYNFTNSSLEAAFEVMNVTNHRNVAAIKYDDNYNREGFKNQLPLMPWLDITYRF